MLNMENGDCGKITHEPCNCSLYKLGYTTRLSSIRSLKRINTEGMTFYVDDIVHAVENVFPARFGGSSLDYQVVEQEEANGLSKIMLYINPEISIPDEQEAITILLQAISYNISRDKKVKILKQAESFSIKRQYLYMVGGGKLLPFCKKIG